MVNKLRIYLTLDNGLINFMRNQKLNISELVNNLLKEKFKDTYKEEESKTTKEVIRIEDKKELDIYD